MLTFHLKGWFLSRWWPETGIAFNHFHLEVRKQSFSIFNTEHGLGKFALYGLRLCDNLASRAAHIHQNCRSVCSPRNLFLLLRRVAWIAVPSSARSCDECHIILHDLKHLITNFNGEVKKLRNSWDILKHITFSLLTLICYVQREQTTNIARL